MEGMQNSPVEDWVADDVKLHDWLTIVQAGHAMGSFDSRNWLHTIDVPTSVVLNAWDEVVPPARQREVAELIPGATRHLVDGGHPVCLAHPDRFAPVLMEAIADVVDLTRRAPVRDRRRDIVRS